PRSLYSFPTRRSSDLVYNHVYERALFPYDQLVPGYFFRHDRHFQPTHSCYLENDVETTNYMVRRLIIDSLVHFVKNYKVDGFRLDRKSTRLNSSHVKI